MLTHAHAPTAQHFDGTDDGDVADPPHRYRLLTHPLRFNTPFVRFIKPLMEPYRSELYPIASPDGPGAGREGAD